MEFVCTPEIKKITNCEGFFTKELTATYLYLLIRDIQKLCNMLEEDNSENKVYYLAYHEFTKKDIDLDALLEKVNSF